MNQRPGEQVSVADAISRVQVGTGFEDYATWTEEQWAAHDARVAADLAREARAAADERARGRWQALVDESGFPRRAVAEARKADEARAAIAMLATWDPTELCILVISGAPGCGKTVAATWWASRAERMPAFVRSATFAASSRYGRGERDGKRDAWLAASALVLDDLGAEYLDDKGSLLVDLDELIDVYYGDRKPLIITTNCNTGQFSERYGARVIDRIRECGLFWETDEESLRGGVTS